MFGFLNILNLIENELDSTFVKRGPSGKMRTADEADIIEKLRDEGLISRPKSVVNGMAFTIGDEQPITVRRLPPRLQRLELSSEEKKKKVETADDIERKLAKAAERRRKKRQERPPRPMTQMSMMSARDKQENLPAEALEIPKVQLSHPETEVLRPPSNLSPSPKSQEVF